MCGIVGKLNFNNQKIKDGEIEDMLVAIKHRGPDGNGKYINNNIGIGHTILKIQDLSDLSIQPYEYKDYVLAFNGEIYNFMELREELIQNDYKFESSTDTEVLIKYIKYAGLEETLKKIEGCFAIVLYNKINNDLYLIRDRFGIKPLYYYIDDNRLVFASEIKGILQDDTIERKFDIETIAISFNCRLWMDPRKTLFQNIYMLEPGSFLKIDKDFNIESTKYYELKFNYKYNNPDDLVKDFGREFEDSIRKKLISKVPVAAFLSGGLDSSVVCKVLNENMEDVLNTYTIKYDYTNNLDLNYAEKISKEEGFEQHNILIDEDKYSIDNIDKVLYSVEEVLIDKVYIAMYFNYKAAKDDGYTVVVSGQGSDEPWLGYIFTWRIFEYLNKDVDEDKLISDYYIKNMVFKDKINESFEKLIEPTMEKYLSENLIIDNRELLNSYSDLSIKTILHDLLMQEDKIAMAHSVESRVPFVDNHRIVELAYNASSNMKLFDKREKYIVRKYSEDKINNEIINRPKYPFPEPPQMYNKKIELLCRENWEEIKNSEILKKILNSKMLESIENFTPVEQWWLLVYWRFEVVFKMEV